MWILFHEWKLRRQIFNAVDSGYIIRTAIFFCMAQCWNFKKLLRMVLLSHPSLPVQRLWLQEDIQFSRNLVVEALEQSIWFQTKKPKKEKNHCKCYIVNWLLFSLFQCSLHIRFLLIQSIDSPPFSPIDRTIKCFSPGPLKLFDVGDDNTHALSFQPALSLCSFLGSSSL